jgi:type IV secretion system protein VirB6
MRMIYRPFLNICLILMLFFAPYHNTNNAWAAFEFNHSCIPAPDFTEFDKTNKTINVGDNLGKWQSAGKSVSNGDSIKFAWNADDIYVPPKKYMVLYRLDPRFERPQVFIKSWNYASKQWDSDFDKFSGACGPGSLTMYQKNPAPLPASGNNNVVYTKCDPNSPDVNAPKYTLLQQFTDYINYFNFIGRSPITVNSGDVINIQAVPASSFFDAGPNFTTNYDINSFSGKKPIHYIYTDVGGLTDGMGTFNFASKWYYYLIYNGFNIYRLNPDENGTQWFYSNNINPALGMANNSTEATAYNNDVKNGNYSVIPDTAIHGLGINIGGNMVKAPNLNFNTSGVVISSFYGGFFYTIAPNSGVIDFISPYWPMGTVAWGNPMFRSVITQMPGINMKTWRPASGPDFTYDDLYQIQNNIQTSGISYIEIYREVLSIEIGGNTTALQNNVGVEYMISPTLPPDGTSGTMVAANDTIYAGSNGSLWIRAVNNDPSYSVSGNLNVYMATYNGPTDISDFVYDDVVNPILTKLNDLTFTLYHGLISNLTFRNIAMSLLTLYIMLYGIYYLAGATNITTYDLVARVVKITIITTLFSPGSWAFFNDHFFTAFINGTSYLIYNIIGTNTHQNIFGFLDVVFNKFTNPDLWGNLLVQFVNFQTALPFFALLVIIGLLKYFLTLLEVVVAYLMAFVTVAVLISLAPFFITFMLFGRTKNLFNNWISALFNAAIYPTILLIFYLLLDDIVTGLLENVAVESCWDTLLPIKFSFTLKPLLDWSPTFSIPGFPGIGFWVPASDAGGIVGQQGSYFTIMTSSIIFFCYANAASGLLGFVTGIVGSLARVGDSAAGVVPSQSMKSILSDVTVAKRMAGNLGARAAIAAYDHGPGAVNMVQRAAIRAGEYTGVTAAVTKIETTSNQLASGAVRAAYNAPKNMLYGAGYSAGKIKAAGIATMSASSKAATAVGRGVVSARSAAKEISGKAAQKITAAVNYANGGTVLKDVKTATVEGLQYAKTKSKDARTAAGKVVDKAAQKATTAVNYASGGTVLKDAKIATVEGLSYAKKKGSEARKAAGKVVDKVAGKQLAAANQALSKTFGKEARDDLKAAGKKMAGDLGDKMLHGVKDIGNAALIHHKKASNARQDAKDEKADKAAERKYARIKAKRAIEDKLYNLSDATRSLADKGKLNYNVISATYSESKDLGKGLAPTQKLQKKLAAQEQNDLKKTSEILAKRTEVLKKRALEDKEINDKRALREQKKQARVDALNDEIIDRSNARADKKEARGKEVKDYREELRAERAAAKKKTDPSKSGEPKPTEYKQRVAEQKQADLLKARDKTHNQEQREREKQAKIAQREGEKQERINQRKVASELKKLHATNLEAIKQQKLETDLATKLWDKHAKKASEALSGEVGTSFGAKIVKASGYGVGKVIVAPEAAGRGLEAAGTKVQEFSDKIDQNATYIATGEAWKDAKKAGGDARRAGVQLGKEAVDATGKAIDGTIGAAGRAAGRGLEAAGTKVQEFSDKIDQNATYIATGEAWKDAKKAGGDARRAGVQLGKEAVDATGKVIKAGTHEALEVVKAGAKVVKEVAVNKFGQEARDNRKATRQKFKGDLGDKLLHGVKDAGLKTVINPAQKGMNKLSASLDALVDAPSEIGHAASLVGRRVADSTHRTLEKGRDLKNNAEHSRVVLKTALKEGYDKGTGVTPEEFEPKQQAREKEIKDVTDKRDNARIAKQQKRSKLLEARERKDDAIGGKSAERANQKQARIDKTKEQEKQREQDRSKKKDIRDKAIDRKIERDRQDKEREKNNKDKSPAEKLREYKEVSEQRKKEDIADARSIAVKYGKKKK